MGYDVRTAPPGADAQKWAAHEAGSCGGYYKCSFCAVNAAAEKLREEQGRRREPTQSATDAAKARDARRAKAKAARLARKAQRRRAR
jgi:hypothetical protein